MQAVKQILIPLIADPVLSPDFVYGPVTGLYFTTTEEQYGRITFEHLDAVKICRGEMPPPPFDMAVRARGVWIYQAEHSPWQQERFAYEKEHYAEAYEFGGDVTEMLTDFKHYLFSFHDEFIEAIARGFWFEQSESPLLGKALTPGHPFLPLPAENAASITVGTVTSQIRKNPKCKAQLIQDAQFCRQTVYAFAFERNGKAIVHHQVVLSYRNGALLSILLGPMGAQVAAFDGWVHLDAVTPYIEAFLEDVSRRRSS